MNEEQEEGRAENEAARAYVTDAQLLKVLRLSMMNMYSFHFAHMGVVLIGKLRSQRLWFRSFLSLLELRG